MKDLGQAVLWFAGATVGFWLLFVVPQIWLTKLLHLLFG